MEAEKHKKITKKNMKALGTYKKEFDPMIDIYADLLEQYDILYKRFIDEGMILEDAEGKKTVLSSTLETLRKDIKSYNDALKLNPKSLQTKGNAEAKESKLEKALASITAGDKK